MNSLIKASDDRYFPGMILLFALVFSILFVKTLRRFNDPLPTPTALPAIIEVRGDVGDPGVYILDGKRVTTGEAIVSAGGLRTDGPAGIPREVSAGEVRSGQVVHVSGGAGRTPEVTVGPMSAAARLAMGLKLDLNRASERELSAVPLMKPEFAVEIVARRSVRPWNSVRELQEIGGIGPKVIEKWQAYLEVGRTGDDGA